MNKIIRQYIWFDDWIKCRNGKIKPFWDFTVLEQIVKDKELMWFHERYGRMELYRVHKVDNDNFVAEDLKISCYTSNENWELYSEKPELALERRTA